MVSFVVRGTRGILPPASDQNEILVYLAYTSLRLVLNWLVGLYTINRKGIFMANFMKMTASGHSSIMRNDRTASDKKGKQEHYHPEREEENFIYTSVRTIEKDGKIKTVYDKPEDENGQVMNWKDKRICDIVDAKKKERLSQVKVLNRKDVKHVVSLVFTVPPEVPQEQQKQCLIDAMHFTVTKFGKENFLAATFHFHEKTPHVTVDFIPVVRDKKTGKEKCSAKEVVNRNMLQTFHGELGQYLDKWMGYHVSVENGKTRKNGHSINWLKETTFRGEKERLKAEKKELESEATYYRNRWREAEGRLNRLKQDNPQAWINTMQNYSKATDCPSDEELKGKFRKFHSDKVKAGRARHVHANQQGQKR